MNRDEESPPPLSSLTAALLAAEKRRQPPTAWQRRALWRRVGKSLGPLGGRGWGARLAAVWVGTLLLGGVAVGGVVVVRGWQPPVAQVSTGHPGTPALPAPPRPNVVTAVEVETADPAGAAADGPRRAEPVAPATRSPRRERTLIDDARAALSRGDLFRAEQALHRHAREFPDGLFLEERSALEVFLLVKSGQAEAGKVAATAFRARFPNSVFLDLMTAMER